MSGPYKPTQREYTMENLNTQMDDQLKNRVAELNRANDENRDGRPVSYTHLTLPTKA